jgi:site-specific recombinase XerD
MFYRFLSTQEKYKDIDLADYHAIADNRDIRRWQMERQTKRVLNQKVSPTSKTIYDEAKILQMFFRFLIENGCVTCVDIKLTTWIANFKNRRMLNYLRQRDKVRINPNDINVLDKYARQKQTQGLITNKEIKALIESFPDPVYAALFKLSLGTAMRPIDLESFPYLGKSINKHIMPYSEMEHSSKTVDYTVEGSKGNKTRVIKINLQDLRALEKHYITPFYQSRALLYKEKYGKELPPSILFLNSEGVPVTPEMISARTNYAKLIAKKKLPEFRDKVKFYDARHWWPTQYLINYFNDEILTSAADVLVAACAEVLRNQMGHEDLETTYKFYIDMARVVMLSNAGIVHELVTSPDESVEDFIERLEKESDG